MPSNALKISYLIHVLEGLRSFHGDLDCVFAVPVEGRLIAIDTRNINVMGEVLGKKLAEPALVVGLWADDAGRIRTSPGEVYQATNDGGEWNYNRASMPEGEDVRVWKRKGGPDIGKRVGEAYFVREGAEAWPPRPVQIIADGILGWKPL
jgi:hypothetical protein